MEGSKENIGRCLNKTLALEKVQTGLRKVDCVLKLRKQRYFAFEWFSVRIISAPYQAKFIWLTVISALLLDYANNIQSMEIIDFCANNYGENAR